MGKKTKAKSKAKAASKAPSRAPARAAVAAPKTSTSKKRVSSKVSGSPNAGTLLDVMGEVFSGASSSNLPALPMMGSSTPVKYNPSTGMFTQRKRKSRKGLSASDIKGFMRVNKFAGMLTKVSGKKHHVVSKRRK